MQFPEFVENAIKQTLGVSPFSLVSSEFCFSYKDCKDRDVAFGGKIEGYNVSQRGDMTLWISVCNMPGGLETIENLHFNVQDPQTRGWYAQLEPSGPAKRISEGRAERRELYGQLLIVPHH